MQNCIFAPMYTSKHHVQPRELLNVTNTFTSLQCTKLSMSPTTLNLDGE